MAAEESPKLKINIVEVNLEYPNFIGSELKNLIQKCFEYDPQKRITMRGILQHPWLQ